LAVDTRDKRASVIHVGLPWRGLLPLPDGTVDQGDRVHVGLFYRALIDEPVQPPEPILAPCFNSLACYAPGFQKLSRYRPGVSRLANYTPGIQKIDKSC